MSMRETCISQIVKVHLTNQDIKTEWFNGTLFVSPLTEQQAMDVGCCLVDLDIGWIDVNAVGFDGEYAFDIC